MKKIYLLTLIAFTILFTNQSCKLIDKLTQFEVPYTTNFTVPATSIINLPLPIGNIVQPTPISTNSSQTFANNNTKADLVEKVLLKKLVLTIKSPSGQKFDFLQSADIYISADGLAELKVASISNIDDATVGATVEMTPSGDDLKDYIKKDAITIRVAATADKSTTSDINIEAKATFFVDAKILGI